MRAAAPDALQVSWYPNVFDRFHEVSVLLPRGAFVACVDIYDYDEKLDIFVKSGWLTGLHLRPYSAFALIDAVGVKAALLRGQLTGVKLVQLRDRIDRIADANPGVATNLDMRGMTMVFKVADPKMLDVVKQGDRVKFAADNVNGALTVTAIEVSK